ncbi:GMC family oxidoreductase [Aureimonas psammosilenae]|uniref:GMC family oxidoreductase n=1 Tax=Aureimonas psammosilenae TaxID=2495496 RepID=UPI001AED92DD|nr:GMC family oxidoreductase [Aureimonas psammosilenae]
MKASAMRRYGENECVDAVVVGTGAGGAPLLAALAAKGLRVVALEAGAHFRPSDHTADEMEGSDINWMEERLTGGETPTAFGANNSGMGVGGSTLHWGAFTPRPDRRDLKLHSLTGVGEDWPIEHAELISYIERVERFLGVSGPADYPWDPGRRYPLPPAKRNASADMMMRGCEALGIRATDAPAAIVSRDWPQEGGETRQACVNCGSCHQGCRNSSKASMDTTYLPLAVMHGAEIRAEARVHGIERDAGGRVTAVLYIQDGREHRQPCANLFLCAGGVETPRLLLHCGLANENGQVGRNFMAHGATQVWGRFDAEMRGYRGYPSSLLTEDMVRPPDADFAGGYLIQSLGVMPLTLATTMARGGGLWGRRLVEAMDNYRFMAGVGINTECLPNENNRLELSAERDEIGMAKAQVSFTMGENETAIDAHATRVMKAIVGAAGGKDAIVLARSAHTIGTCRMGTDPDRAVVDSDGRSFTVPNLFICDNSVFPSALAANPALTIMALSLRTADRFLSPHG